MVVSGPASEQASARAHDLPVRLPTLTVINLTFGDWLRTFSPVMRTLILATVAVPIVIYGLMSSSAVGCRVLVLVS